MSDGQFFVIYTLMVLAVTIILVRLRNMENTIVGKIAEKEKREAPNDK